MADEQVEQRETAEDAALADEGERKPAEGAERRAGSERTFTQSEVSRMMAREKAQGRSSALAELGIDPKDTEAVALVKAFLESRSAVQKDADDSAKGALEDAENRAAMAEAKLRLIEGGVSPAYVDDAVSLVLAKAADAPDGPELDLEGAIHELRPRYPMFFGADGDKGDTGTGAPMGGADAGAQQREERGSLGRRLAAQRPKSTGKSFWTNG